MAVSGRTRWRQLNATMHQEMDMTWDVQGVNDERRGGDPAEVRRVKMKMTSPIGGFRIRFEVGGRSDRSGGHDRADVQGDDQGRIRDHDDGPRRSQGREDFGRSARRRCKTSPGAAAMGDIATAEGFKRMISQGALVLPRMPPKEGDTWQTKVEMNNPAAASKRSKRPTRYEGTKEIDGTKYAVIKPELKMEFERAANGQEWRQRRKLFDEDAEQSSDGEVLFNIDEGRLHSTTLEQNVTIDATVAGQTIQQKIDQKIDVKVTPAGEKKAEMKRRRRRRRREAEAERARKRRQETRIRRRDAFAERVCVSRTHSPLISLSVLTARRALGSRRPRRGLRTCRRRVAGCRPICRRGRRTARHARAGDDAFLVEVAGAERCTHVWAEVVDREVPSALKKDGDQPLADLERPPSPSGIAPTLATVTKSSLVGC